MLRSEREERRSQSRGFNSLEHRVLAEIAGYAVQKQFRSFNDDQSPVEDTAYYSVINAKTPIQTDTGVAAATPNEAWQTFLTMLWRPDQKYDQCLEVLRGAALEDKKELGRQIQADLQDLDAPTSKELTEGSDPMTHVKEGEPFTFEQIADFALMSSKALLRSVLGCDFAQKMCVELEAQLSAAKSQ